MADGESLNDLIKKSGGFTENAYPFGAVYENQTAFIINKMAKDKLYEEFIDNIITVSQKNPTGNFDLTADVELTQNLKDSMPNGRVVVDLLDELATEKLVIKDGDTLTIPEKSDHIYIYGELNYEGALKYDENMDIDFYINKAGGLRRTQIVIQSMYFIRMEILRDLILGEKIYFKTVQLLNRCSFIQDQ